MSRSPDWTSTRTRWHAGFVSSCFSRFQQQLDIWYWRRRSHHVRITFPSTRRADVVSRGAEIGLISQSLALAPALRDKGRFWQVPIETYPRREQGGVILSWAHDRPAAEALRDFVLGEGGRAILRRHGFQLQENSWILRRSG